MHVEVSTTTGRTLQSMAAIRGWTIGQVIDWLLEREVDGVRKANVTQCLEPSEVEIFGSYRRKTVTAVLDRTNRSVRMTSGALAGRRYDSPSGAAKAVVLHLNPTRQHPAQNGLVFWRLADGRKIKEILP